MNALHAIARSLGIQPGSESIRCCVCGESPFALIGRKRQSLGAIFSNHENLRAPQFDAVCEGCKTVLGGRPGRDPPPLRMASFMVSNGQFRAIDRAALWDLLQSPPPGNAVVSYGRSRKKQHALHAGFSGAGVWRVGSDDGPVEWRHNPRIIRAVGEMRRLGVSKGAILTGRYPAAKTAALQKLDAVIAPIRGSAALDMIVWCSPEAGKDKIEENPMIDPIDQDASDLLAIIAWHSSYRASEGLRFWGGYYLSRIRRLSRLPLNDFISRACRECQATTAGAAEAAEFTARRDGEQCAAVIRAIRERPDLLHGLAFAQMEQRRKLK